MAMCQREPYSGPPGSMRSPPPRSLHALIADFYVYLQATGLLGVEEKVGLVLHEWGALILFMVPTGCLV